jgi:hypothetical protein
METRLEKLRAGAVLVSPEDRAKALQRLRRTRDAWRKRRALVRPSRRSLASSLCR